MFSKEMKDLMTAKGIGLKELSALLAKQNIHLTEDGLEPYRAGNFDGGAGLAKSKANMKAILAVLRKAGYKEVRRTAFPSSPQEMMSVLGSKRTLLAKCLARGYERDLARRLGPTLSARGDWADQDVPLLALKHWLPERPVPLQELDSRLRADNRSLTPGELRPTLAAELAELGRVVEDNPLYRLRAIEGERELQFVFATETPSYRHYVNSCEALNYETARAYLELGSPGKHDDLSRLYDDLRPMLDLRAETPPFDFLNRCVAVGINTLTILASRRDACEFLMHERGGNQQGAKLAEAHGTRHVVPAGTFQPLHQARKHHLAELSFFKTVRREFGEEVLGQEALIRANASLYDPDQFFARIPELKTIHDLFAGPCARTYFLGCALDPLTLKLEVLTLLIVNKDFLVERDIDLRSNWEGRLEQIEFNRPELRANLSMPHLLGAGAGCLALAFRHFDDVSEEIAAVSRSAFVD